MRNRFVTAAPGLSLLPLSPGLTSQGGRASARPHRGEPGARVATSGNQPPFSAVSRDGELIGLEVDLARMLAEAMNVNLTFMPLPFLP